MGGGPPWPGPLDAELAERGRVVPLAAPKEPPRPWSHPDFVLARAVEERVIDAGDAEVIGETRLGGVPLERVAAEWEVPYDTLQKRRRRAELRLARWLLGDDRCDHRHGR